MAGGDSVGQGGPMSDQREESSHSREALFEQAAPQSGMSDRIEKLEQTMLAMRQYEGALQASTLGKTAEAPAMGWCCVIESTKTQTAEKKGRLYTEYLLSISTPGQLPVRLGKRYSQFLELHRKLCKTFPHVALPPNSAQLFNGLRSSMWFNRFDADFIECRRVWLEAYTSDVLNTPALAHSAMVQAFIETDVLLNEFVDDVPPHLTPLTPTSAAGLRGGYVAPPPTQARHLQHHQQAWDHATPQAPPAWEHATPQAPPSASKETDWAAARLNKTLPTNDSSPGMRGQVAGAFTPQPFGSTVMSLRQARQASLSFSPLQVVAPVDC